MNPRFIGYAPHRIYCVFHEPAVGFGPRDAVLLCPPVGAEHLRTHRMYRLLAERLAAQGHACMRFDYSGTGDSQGDLQQASFEDWLDDTNEAAVELKNESLAEKIVLVGCRLGAAIAYLAAEREGLPVSQMFLIDPVVDGSRYLSELRRAHREKLKRWRSHRESVKTPQVEELLGYVYSSSMLNRINELTLHAPASSIIQPARHVMLSEPAKRTSDLFDRWIEQTNAHLHVFNQPCHWGQFEALERQLVQHAIIDAVCKTLADKTGAVVGTRELVQA